MSITIVINCGGGRSLGVLWLFGAVLAACSSSWTSSSPPESPYDLVSPFIGSGGAGYGTGSMNPGAQVPNGFVRLGPDTCDELPVLPWNHFSGYYYGDKYIRYFSHTHLVGAGSGGLGQVGLMPSTKAPSSHTVKNYGYKSKFSHEQESAHPGTYAVSIEGVNVALTATQLVGVHKYSFTDASGPNYVYLYASASLVTCTNAKVVINTTAQEMSGYTVSSGGLDGGNLTVYFVATFTEVISSPGTWSGDSVSDGTTETEGSAVGAYVKVGCTAASSSSSSSSSAQGCSVEVHVGISLISLEQARVNLAAQLPLPPSQNQFESVLAQAAQVWEDILNRATVEGGSRNDRIMFHTAVYQAMMAPTNYMEAGRVYRGFDNAVHVVPEGRSGFYSDLSIWDEFRTKQPLLVLISASLSSDIVWSLEQMYQQSSVIPRWPLANREAGAMIGNHADIIIMDAYLKGVSNINLPVLYEGMYAASTSVMAYDTRNDLWGWLNLGFVRANESGGSVADTLEYAYDDYVVSAAAAALGQSSNASRFLATSGNWKNLWDSSATMMCGRNGPNTPFILPDYLDFWSSLYVEGDAQQWRWFVCHDVPGLIEAFGGATYFVEQLNEFFEKGDRDPLNVLPNEYFWAGNEPDLFTPYMFVWAGAPNLTQKWVRNTLVKRYTPFADGLPGNNDYGTMSSWLAFGMMGFYPLAGTPTYIFGSPLFSSMTLNLTADWGTSLTIKTSGGSAQNVYVQNCTLNGEPFESALFEHSNIVDVGNAAGTLIECDMGPNPTAWGTNLPSKFLQPGAPPTVKPYRV